MCAIKVERERSYISRSVNLNGIVALYIKLKGYFKLGPPPLQTGIGIKLQNHEGSGVPPFGCPGCH